MNKLRPVDQIKARHSETICIAASMAIGEAGVAGLSAAALMMTSAHAPATNDSSDRRTPQWYRSINSTRNDSSGHPERGTNMSGVGVG